MMSHLRKGKARYKVVSRVANADWEFPGVVDSSIRDIRMTDQDVILARVGRGSHLHIFNAKHGHYRDRFSFDVPGVDDFDFTRGWASVDARVGSTGEKFRLFNTHLEVFDQDVQMRQARSLLSRARKSRLPVILAGDFNSDANSGGAAYELVKNAGFVDVWQQVHPQEAGATCCQDDDLRNGSSKLSSRIDFVWFSSNRLSAFAAERIGEEAADTTPSGLWPSDHAGVIADLRFA